VPGLPQAVHARVEPDLCQADEHLEAEDRVDEHAVRTHGVVVVDRLVEELWPARAPATARQMVKGYIADLRRGFGDARGCIITHATGYRLHAEPRQVDADRFHELVTSGYYDDNRFFRVVAGRWAQFGINGDPLVAKAWREKMIPDDARRQANVRGTVAFAFESPNGRSTQVYIALGDLSSTQDAQGFAPFGRVVSGMEIADALNSEYGENSGSGIRAGRQQPLFDGGNAYLDRAFPRLDRIIRARVLP